ncbi:MAG: hypothetical protein AB7F89_24110 [Pirellulaceae bacterium]
MAKRRAKGKTSKVSKNSGMADVVEQEPEVLSEEPVAESAPLPSADSPVAAPPTKEPRKRRKKRGRPRKAVVAVESDALDVDELLEAKKLADRVGGVDKAQSLLGTLKKLM